MPISITDLNSLDSAKIASVVDTLTQLVQERHPEIELTRGVFHDLVLYFNGLLNATVQENVDRVLQSKSLLAITQDPTLADTDLVDQVLSNYNLTRDNGTPATGVITLIFNLPTSTAIATSSVLTANGVQFAPTANFTILPPTALPSAATDHVMIPVGDGTYTANITVIATTVGAAGNIKRYTKLLPNFVPNNVLGIFATSDFISGRNPLTNEEYIAKLSNGLAAKTIGGRKSYEAFIRNQPAFANTLHLSILGCGDAEQQRDQHSLFPISGGGKVDIYAQTNSYAQTADHVVDAVFIRTSPNGSIWQTTLTRDMAAGFYEVIRVSKPTDITSSGYAVVKDVRGVDLASNMFVPDIRLLAESAYTRYQTAVIQFEDTDTPVGPLVLNTSTAKYAVTTLGLPLIGEMSDVMTDRDVRPRGADVLVKAAVPCFTKISFQVRTEINAPLADTTIAAIKTAIVAAVAKVGFSGQLHASLITGAAQSFLTGRQAISEIDMFGRIRRPDGSIAFIRDSELLTVPNDPARLVTGRTVAFLVGPDDISISSVAAGFLS
jgi:hypothetical protein